jgi:hypothetical protein
MNFRLWFNGDWKNGGVVRAVVKNYGPVFGVSRAGTTCEQEDGWRKSEIYWNPKANSGDSSSMLYCYFDASFEFELKTAQSSIELTFQEFGDINFGDVDLVHQANSRWWGVNRLQVWSTTDPVAETLKRKRGRNAWGKHRDLIMHQDYNADMKTLKPNTPYNKWKYTTQDNTEITAVGSYSQIIGPKLKFTLGSDLADKHNNLIQCNSASESMLRCADSKEMRVSYDPSNPKSKNVQKIELYLPVLPGGIWYGLSGGVAGNWGESSPYAYTMNGKYTGRSRYIKMDFRIITVGRWNNNEVSLWVRDQRDSDVEYVVWTLTLNAARTISASKGCAVTQGSGDQMVTGTIIGPKATILKTPTAVSGTTVEIRTPPGVTFVSTKDVIITPNEEAFPTVTISASSISSASSVTKTARSTIRGRLFGNKKKLWPGVSGRTYANPLPLNTGKRTHPYACLGGWKVLPESIWLTTLNNAAGSSAGLRNLHGVACYMDVEIRRIHNWGNPIFFSFESDISNNFGDNGELASYFAISDLKVYGNQKVEVSDKKRRCPGDECSGMMVGLTDGISMNYGTYFGAMTEQSFGNKDWENREGDLRWDHGLRSYFKYGGGALSSPELGGKESRCVPKPYSWNGDNQLTYDRSTCNLCGDGGKLNGGVNDGDFWCVRNQGFPNATFLDPLRSDVNDPIRGRKITKLTVKAFGAMNADKWHLNLDKINGHVRANGKLHASKIPPSGRNYWLYCNDCYESGTYTVNENEVDNWGYNYAEAVVSGGGAGTWSITSGTGKNSFAIEPPEFSGWCLNRVEYHICAKPGPPVIEKIEVLKSDMQPQCASSSSPVCEVDSDGESTIRITGYNFGPHFQTVKYGPLATKGLGYEMKSCNLTANYGNREVICKSEPGAGDDMYVVLYANDQPSTPFNARLKSNNVDYENNGFALNYKKPKILPNIFVSNSLNSYSVYNASTDGSDAPVAISAIHTAVGHVGRVVDILINTCEENEEGDGISCDYAETAFGSGGAGDADDVSNPGNGESQPKASVLSLPVSELTEVRDVSLPAFVNFTIRVTVTVAKYGEIGQSMPDAMHRGIIFYQPPSVERFVDVVIEGNDTLVKVKGKNFGGSLNVGGYKICGRRNSTETCNQVAGDAKNPTLTNNGLTNLKVESWTHNLVVFRMDTSECCPGSVYLQVGSSKTRLLQYPGQSPKLALTAAERSKIADNRDGNDVAQYYSTQGGETIVGIKVKFLTIIDKVKITIGGLEATILLQNGAKGVDLGDGVFSYNIRTPAGQGTDQPLQVINTNLATSAGSDELLLNYKAPVLSSITLEGSASPLATLGSNSVRYMEQKGIPTLGFKLVLRGSNFGQEGYVKWCLEPSVTIDGCDEATKHRKECCNKWIKGSPNSNFEYLDPAGGTYDHSEIKINIPPGVGVGRAIYVVQHRNNELSQKYDQESEVFALRYKQPVITSIRYEGSSSTNLYADTRGGTTVTLAGEHFGSGSAIGEVQPNVPKIHLYRQDDVRRGLAAQRAAEKEDTVTTNTAKTNSITNANYYKAWNSIGPSLLAAEMGGVDVIASSWSDGRASFQVPKGIGYNISIVLTVRCDNLFGVFSFFYFLPHHIKHSFLHHRLTFTNQLSTLLIFTMIRFKQLLQTLSFKVGQQSSKLNADSSLFRYNSPTISAVAPASVPSSGLVHDTCSINKPCGPASGICDVGVCSKGRPINMTITGDYFGDSETSNDGKTNNNEWRIRVQYINLGQITVEVEAESMAINQNLLSFSAPNSFGQAESTGYRVIVGNQVSKVYRQFSCGTGKTECQNKLNNFTKIENKLLKDAATDNKNDINADRNLLIDALRGLEGTGKTVVDLPTLIKVEPLQGPTDGCAVIEPQADYQRRRQAETGEKLNADGSVIASTVDDANELDLPAKCIHRDRVTISGLSLGNGIFDSNRLEVWLTNETVEGSGYKVFDAKDASHLAACNSVQVDLSTDDANDQSLAGACSHRDNKLVFPAPISPPNYGKNLYFYVKIGGSRSVDSTKNGGKAFLSWEFSPPNVTGVTPTPLDARGADEKDTVSPTTGELCSEKEIDCLLEIRGRNFGGSTSSVAITVGGKECLNPEWKPAHPDDGLPYLRCKTQEDVVGVKETTIVVASQSRTFEKGVLGFSSRCKFCLLRLFCLFCLFCLF